MNSTLRWISPTILLAAWLVSGVASDANAAARESCPFCSAASQTLRQESQSMDAVAIASLVTDGRADIDGNATFEVERVLRGEALLEKGQKVEAVYFGPGKSNKKFLLLGVDPRNLVWSTPLPLSEDAVKYIDAIQSLPDDQVARLDFYQKYFEHPDSLLARDSYDEFALAPYEEVKKLKDKMDREQLMAWVQDPQKSPDRKRLYYTMLGICGQSEDADAFEAMIQSDDQEKRAGLDALIAAYLMLKGADGLKLVDEKFLANRKASYPDVYSAVMALRFHGTEGTVIPKEEILKSMRHLIEAPDLADLVIPDLARWGDWSQVDRLSELFKTANEDNSWVRVPVVNYLRACPLPEAKARLEELEKIDPKAVKRAATFFPIPSQGAAKPKQNDSSSWKQNMPPKNIAESDVADRSIATSAPVRPKLTSQFVHGWSVRGARWEPISDSIYRENSVTSTPLSLVSREAFAANQVVENAWHSSRTAQDDRFVMNCFSLLSVIGLAGMTFWALMWMIAADMFRGETAFLQRCIFGRRARSECGE